MFDHLEKDLSWASMEKSKDIYYYMRISWQMCIFVHEGVQRAQGLKTEHWSNNRITTSSVFIIIIILILYLIINTYMVPSSARVENSRPREPVSCRF